MNTTTTTTELALPILAAMTREKAGTQKGKKDVPRQVIPFHPNTLTDYRKLHKHQQAGQPRRREAATI